MYLRTGVMLLVLGAVWSVAAPAQTTAIGTRRPRKGVPAAESVAQLALLNARVKLDSALFRTLLDRFDASEKEEGARDKAAGLLPSLLMSPTPSRATIADILRDVAHVPAAHVDRAADALLALATGGEPTEEPGGIAELLFTNLSTSATPDRAIAASTVVEFEQDHFTLKFVTAVAVSNAKDEDEATTSDAFRTNSADLLAILQEGGNGVLRLAVPITRPEPSQSGWHVALAFDGGVMGDWLSADTKSRYLVGGVAEVVRTFRATQPANRDEQPWLFTGLRAGIRYGGKGILADVDEKTLGFGQAVVEFRLPNGAVPVGISLNVVPRDFRPFARGVHVYARVGR